MGMNGGEEDTGIELRAQMEFAFVRWWTLHFFSLEIS